MKRFKKNSKAHTYFLIRKRYQEKRQKHKWKSRKRNKELRLKNYFLKVRKQKKIPPIVHKAPEKFSFIDNTNEVLEYFNKAKKLFKKNNNVNFDISDVSELTPDAITLLVASIKSRNFIKNGVSSGNAPKDKELNKIFAESGFGEHVNPTGNFKFKNSQPGNLLHKEVSKKVVPELAKKACITGLSHVFGNSNIFSPLYEILIECMSNTHNHADPKIQGECKWWLYVYNDPTSKKTTYSFVDLGVGIFKSSHTQTYVQKIKKITGIYSNMDIADDLLAGKINSRIEKDRDIRGKGIPQIVRHSKNKVFRSFYIISNDVKIDLTNNKKESLKENFEGTFLHWELI